MSGYDDSEDEGNSVKYRTGKPCINGCGRPAGTAWGRYWCFECNVARIKLITGQLESIAKSLSTATPDGEIVESTGG